VAKSWREKRRKNKEITHLPPLFNFLHPHSRAPDSPPSFASAREVPAKSQKVADRVLSRSPDAATLGKTAAQRDMVRFVDPTARGVRALQIDFGKPSDVKSYSARPGRNDAVVDPVPPGRRELGAGFLDRSRLGERAFIRW